MTARLSLFGTPDATAAKAVGHFVAANKTILQESALPAVTQKLVHYPHQPGRRVA